jgi:hypothetical protein
MTSQMTSQVEPIPDPLGYRRGASGFVARRLSSLAGGWVEDFAGEFGPNAGDGVKALSELGLGDVTQQRNQSGVADVAKKFFGFLGELEPVVPIADDILHMLEVVYHAASFGLVVTEFGDVTGALADDAVLMERLFGKRNMVAAQLSQLGQGQGQGFGVGRNGQAGGGAFQATAYFIGSFEIKGPGQFLFPLGALFDQRMDKLCLVTVAARDFQTAQGGDLHIKIAHTSGLLAQACQQPQQFLIVAVGFDHNFAEQGLDATAVGAKLVDTLRRRFLYQPGQLAS